MIGTAGQPAQPAAPPRASQEVGFEDLAEIQRAGGATVGSLEFRQGQDGQAVLLDDGACVRFAAAGRLDVGEGTLELRVALLRPQAEGERRTLFHADVSTHEHLTVFLPAPGKLLFVYKGQATAWRGAQVTCDPWQPGHTSYFGAIPARMRRRRAAGSAPAA